MLAANIAPDRILALGYAFRKAKVLLSAVELDLFTALAYGPLYYPLPGQTFRDHSPQSGAIRR